MKIAGIDEAGRGPVIGPMAIAIVMIEKNDMDKIERLGIKDSKLLSPRRREELYEIITNLDYATYEIRLISPKEIDDCLNSENFNLNWLEAINSSMLINSTTPDKVILDLPSNNEKAYSDYVRKNLNINCNIVAEHKADLNYTIVGAASILAKVSRDREIEKIKRKHKVDFGSGYPSDPKTVEFLKNNYDKKEFSAIFRKSWQSYKKINIGKNQKKLGEF